VDFCWPVLIPGMDSVRVELETDRGVTTVEGVVLLGKPP
jgi:hypothetical protein